MTRQTSGSAIRGAYRHLTRTLTPRGAVTRLSQAYEMPIHRLVPIISDLLTEEEMHTWRQQATDE